MLVREHTLSRTHTDTHIDTRVHTDTRDIPARCGHSLPHIQTYTYTHTIDTYLPDVGKGTHSLSHTRRHTRTYIYTYVYTHIRAYIDIFMYCISLYVYIHTCIHIYTHIRTNIAVYLPFEQAGKHTHICTDIHIYSPFPSRCDSKWSPECPTNSSMVITGFFSKGSFERNLNFDNRGFRFVFR